MSLAREATHVSLGTDLTRRLWPASRSYRTHRAGHESVGTAPRAQRTRITNEVPGWGAGEELTS
jgi:hypothetical protein